MLEYILIIIALSYFLLFFVFFIGTLRSKKLKRSTNSESIPFVSVIVAARNEEDNIANCLNSILNNKYSKDKFEVIVVNDDSSDDTENRIIDIQKIFPNLILLNSRNYHKTNLKGKIRALSYGIESSNGEIIMMTDADCLISENWIQSTINYFDINTGLVCGITKIDKRKSFFSIIQSLDWIFLQSIATSSSGINVPLSCIGNNLSVRKSVYEEIGGYENIAFSVTEDLALLRTINKIGKYKIKYPIDNKCVVETAPCKSFKELYNQKRRWFRGGLGISLLGYILGFELFLMNTILLTGFFWMNLKLYSILIIIKAISELLIMLPLNYEIRIKNIFYYFPFFEIYFAIYGLSLPFTFITNRKIFWKERNH